MLIKSIVGLLALAALVSASITSYDGYKIYDVQPKNEFQKGFLLQLSKNEKYDFFLLPKIMDRPARVMVQPEDQQGFEKVLNNFGISFEVVNENVGESIALEAIENERLRSVMDKSSRISFSAFQRFDDINAYLDELAASYSGRVNVQTVGQSYEGRDIKTITITNGNLVANKKVIFVDAGIHAREWIAPAAALYIIHELVENYEDNADLLASYDWVVLPVVNPDGYEYTHTSTRMWRKTRQPIDSSCYGTDANRNFDFHWGETGASSYSCSDTFKGKSAFSEPETQLVRDIMHSLTGRGKFYLTLHSYGNYLLYPWGYTSSLPSNYKDLDEVAQAGATAIKSATGTKYTVGSSTNVLYAAAGGSDDYALAEAEIPISITMELPAGGTGFDPKPSQIQSFVEETWIGIRAMAEKVVAKY